MRTETLVLDLSNQSIPRTITARENDRNGFKVIGNLRERGKSVDLTGFAVFYEAISPLGMFVRDIAVITNFRDGVFEYIVSKEAVSSSGVWIGYFAFEKGTERFTTQDIRISLGVDVKSGSIQLENYISEFDKIKKQIDALQIAVDKADVVKRSGGTITGLLTTTDNFRFQAGGERSITWRDGNDTEYIKLYANSGGNRLGLWSTKSNKAVWEYHGDSDIFNVTTNTNLLKKTGDTMTGYLRMDTESGEKGIIYKDNTAEFLKVYTGKNRNHGLLDIIANKPVYEYDFNTKTFSILADFKTKNDTDWINLTLLNGVKQQSSQPASAIKRSGNVVNIVCAITDFKDKQVIANVPAIFRPDREMLFTCDYFQGLVLKPGYVIVKPNGDIYLEGIEAAVSLYRFALTYIV